ncbi:hypothetical protein Klosneuvirus_6_17 [Klosneuvirus KNV1]|uniref:Uncharacterized protein n=1 Tax=Klosneuvirus KNV1 TaxID=1977640 RepID=A0A1V0SL37_9VIRU|nr:hypothetical protein Klosneuvirus_6_17 [Klosneuvirus KNV1]
MEYSEAVSVVNSNYGTQASKIVSVLSEEAIQTLANLCKLNTKRDLADYTIDRLATMESWRQSGYIANPFLQWLMDSVTVGGPVVATQPVQETKQVAPVNNKKPEPEKKPAKVEEEEDDGATMFDLFG